MVSTINRSALASDLSASYQRVNQAQAKVEESRRLVDTNRAELEKSNVRLDKDKDHYSAELQQSKSVEKNDLRYAVQKGSNTQQLDSSKTSTANTGGVQAFAFKPTVNTSGQTVGTTINTTA
jgi:hypothetical protein